MPIFIKDYTWTQTTNTLHLRVPVSSSFHEKVDIFTTDSYIKIHFNPYLLELFLYQDVDTTKSKCTVHDDIIVMNLLKKTEGDWPNLEKELTKAEKMELKDKILKESQEKALQEKEDKAVNKSQKDRFTVQKAMEIDNIHHSLIESRRNAERDKAMDQLEEWRREREPMVITDVTDEEAAKENGGEAKVEVVDIIPEPQTKPTVTRSRKPIKSEYVENKKKEMATRVVPRLRDRGDVEFSHTKRVFPTPTRESAAQEEETWLKNVTLARRATGFVSEDLRPEEQDPQWCKEKGDEFFKTGNFLGAISAYSHGIKLSEKLPTLYANRSAAHFALGNFNKCLNDCSTAIDLMKPACEGNRKSRAKCIARRAAALARVGYLSKAINEMKAAAKLLPEDEAIKKDIYDMERAWEQNPDSD